MGATKIQFKAIGTSINTSFNDVFPFITAFHHQTSDNSVLGITLFDFSHFVEVIFERTVCDELNIVKANNTGVFVMDGFKATGYIGNGLA